MRWLKQSTTVTVQVGPYLDSTDGVTAETGLSPTIEISKAGAAFAARNSATAISHDADGWYRVELNTTDTATVGPLMLKGTETGATPVWHEFMVLPANVYDSLVGGTDNLQVDTVQWLGTACATPTTAGVPEVDATHIAGAAVSTGSAQIGANVVSVATAAITAGAIGADAIGASELAADAVAEIAAAVPTAAAIADAVWDEATSGHVTAGTFGRAITPEVGTAQSATSTTIVLSSGASATDDVYNGMLIIVVSGTGAVQGRTILDYVGSTKTATVATWTTTPDSTSRYFVTGN